MSKPDPGFKTLTERAAEVDLGRILVADGANAAFAAYSEIVEGYLDDVVDRIMELMQGADADDK